MGVTLYKPSNCTCAYPQLIARNMNGHDESCPVYIEWARDLDLEQKRAKARPVEVMLELCPGCDQYGVPPATQIRPYKFCLRCDWTDRYVPA